MILYPGKFIFLAQPHTASTAIRQALIDSFPEAIVNRDHGKSKYGFQHYPMSDLREGPHAEALTGKEVAWAVRRNPYDLVVTWFLRRTRRPQRRWTRMPFAQFLREFDLTPYIVDGKTLWHEADEWIEYENLDAEINALFDRLGLPTIEIGRENETPGKQPWRSYYDAETIGK